jgi:hypothetical protein
VKLLVIETVKINNIIWTKKRTEEKECLANVKHFENYKSTSNIKSL